MKIECAPGTHSVTFAYKEGTSLFGKETITVEVKSGLETKVIGFIDGTGSSGSSESQTTVMQPIEVKKEAAVKIESSIVPATTSSPETKTTVTFPTGSFNDDSSNAVLNLSVKSAGSEFSVTSSSGSSPVAGIDIALLINGEKVTSFNGKEVVIETYIAKNLTDVVVKYNGTDGDDPIATDNTSASDKTVAEVLTSTSSATALGYNPDTGLLRFMTNHFSEYYVLANVEALNVNTGVPYKSLATAIADAKDGQEIQLMKNVSISSYLLVNKKITVDLNGKTVTTVGDSVNAFIVSRNGNLTIKGGSVTASGKAIWAYYDGVIRIEDGSYTSTGGEAIMVGAKDGDSFVSGNLIINDGTFNSQEMTVVALGSSKVTINGGQFTANDNAVIGTNGSQCFTEATYDIEINGGTFYGETESTGYIACGIYMANRGTVTLNGGTFNINGGVGVLVRSGELIANDVTFNISSKEGLESGNVGDAKINIKTPAQIVIDTKANYPGGAPVIAVNKTSYVPKTLDGKDVVTIDSKEGLMTFATNVNNDNDGDESTVLLMADIDLQGETWTPIGPNADRNNKFKGVFHGQNHVIKNMTVDQSTVAEYQAAGFFGALNGTAMNLIFENANVSSLSAPNVEGNTDNGTAVVAGSIYQSGLIKNVTVKNSSVSANRYVGGIAGYAYGSVKNCTVDGLTLTVTPDNLHDNKYDNGDKAGGIVGAFWHENTYEISGNTSKNVKITGYRDLGGIAGFANGNVKNNTVDELTINQDYSILSEPKTTVEAIIGRHDGFEVDSSNTSSNVTINSSNSTT